MSRTITGFEPALLPVTWALTILSCALVAARLITKSLKFHGPVWEDYLMIIAAVRLSLNFLLLFMAHAK